MTPVQIAEAAVGAVLFALCLAGYIHTSGGLKHADVPAPDDGAAVKRFKKKKTRKKLFFAGLIISVWFLIGFVITFFSGRKGGLVIAFEMFSKRVDVFGVSVAQTTLISLAVCGCITVLCVLFRVVCVPRFKDRPTGLQNAVEICVEAMDKMVVGVVGEKTGAALSPYMFALALYMIGCAAVELFGLRAPTSDLTCTFAMGLLTFLFINIFGFKTLGFGGRLKSMGGAVPAMRPMMIPLKIVSDVAVPVSLACRL
ncbi:MAG: F0F1 ATP synthase subunit A, partial [Clostridia bacterium]|nr:F0F1 ATP synthase subunit A [Clostridia bacterium]